MNKAIIAIAGAGLLASACASDPYGYNGGGSNQAVRQGAIGAGLGGVARGIGGDNGGGRQCKKAAAGRHGRILQSRRRLIRLSKR